MLRGFCDFSSFDATGADLHALRAALGQLHSDRLQVWIKPTRRSIVGMRDIVAELGSFIADFATFGHDIDDTSRA